MARNNLPEIFTEWNKEVEESSSASFILKRTLQFIQLKEKKGEYDESYVMALNSLYEHHGKAI